MWLVIHMLFAFKYAVCTLRNHKTLEWRQIAKQGQTQLQDFDCPRVLKTYSQNEQFCFQWY